MTVEEEFLDLLLKLVRELPMADIYQMDAQPTSQPLHSSQATQTALQVCSCCLCIGQPKHEPDLHQVRSALPRRGLQHISLVGVHREHM